MTGLGTRGLWVVVAVLAVVCAGAVWAAGSGPAPGPATATGSVRLGPDPGQDVGAYLAGLPGRLPPPGERVPALVQFARPLDVATAAGVVAPGPPAAGAQADSGAPGAPAAPAPGDPAGPGVPGAAPAPAAPAPAVPGAAAATGSPPATGSTSAPNRSDGSSAPSATDAPVAPAGPGEGRVETAVFRVPLDRVQTALRFEPVTGTGDPVAALGVARERAAFGAEADADRAARAVAGATNPEARDALARRAAVAAAERRALADPSCACVIALVVTADRAGLEALAARAGVRAVEAAPPGTTTPELALSPLLPEQTAAATPPPDDGPVPAG